MLSRLQRKELKPQLCRIKATPFWSRSLSIHWIYQSLLFYKQSQSQKSPQIFRNNRLLRQGGQTFCTRKRAWPKMTNKQKNKTKYKLKSLERTQLAVNWWTSRQIEGQPHKGIGLRRKGTNIWHATVSESPKHMANEGRQMERTVYCRTLLMRNSQTQTGPL